MLSRVAEAVYWAARYVERAENTARLFQVHAGLEVDLAPGAFPGWEAPLKALGWTGGGRAAISGAPRGSEAVPADRKRPDRRFAARFLLSDPSLRASALACLAGARENLRAARDVLPRAAWEQLNRLFILASASTRDSAADGLPPPRQFPFADMVKLGCQEHVGVLTGTLSRNTAYHFTVLGRRLERADMVARILQSQAAGLQPASDFPSRALRDAQWRGVLQSVSGYHMYRLDVRPGVEGGQVLRFLLRNPDFPRSVGRCLAGCGEPLRRLPRSKPILQKLRQTREELRRARVERMSPPEIRRFLEKLLVSIARLHQEVSRAYFLHPAGGRDP